LTAIFDPQGWKSSKHGKHGYCGNIPSVFSVCSVVKKRKNYDAGFLIEMFRSDGREAPGFPTETLGNAGHGAGL
jgi:hypothetical protein